MDPTNQITLYGLQSCAHCKAAREYLSQKGVPFETIYLDLLVGDERNQTMRDVSRINPAVSFPTIVIQDKVVVGFRRDDIEKALIEARMI